MVLKRPGRTVYAGTSVLLVVHVRTPWTAEKGRSGHKRTRSDELMDELEQKLGDQQMHLMEIKLSYLHSAFPQISPPGPPQNGVYRLQSRIETSARVALTRNSSESVWSPRSKVPQSSLFSLMVQHWGDEKAIAIQRRITDSKIAPPDPAVVARQPAMLKLGVAHEHSTSDSTTDAVADKTQDSCPACLDGEETDASERWKRWCGDLWDTAQRPEAGIKTPVNDVYYFGESAIKTLGAPDEAKGVKGRRSDRPAESGGIVPARGGGNPKFWDWGSWF